MKSCASCSREVSENFLFCPICGSKLSSAELVKFDDDAQTMVAAYDLHKSYLMGKTAVNALRGVDLKVKLADFVSIMGPSGSGKSTLMHLIGGLDTPSRGHVVIRTQEDKLVELSNLSKDNLADIRLKVTGFIFQQFYLLPTLNARENVSIPLTFRGDKSDSFVRNRVQDLLELVGLKNRAHHLPSELSGGEQQRVAIARALANDPPLILADEPTGDLDTRTGKQIMDMLNELNKMGKTIVMVTHDPKVGNMAKPALYMEDGKFVEG